MTKVEADMTPRHFLTDAIETGRLYTVDGEQPSNSPHLLELKATAAQAEVFLLPDGGDCLGLPALDAYAMWLEMVRLKPQINHLPFEVTALEFRDREDDYVVIATEQIAPIFSRLVDDEPGFMIQFFTRQRRGFWVTYGAVCIVPKAPTDNGNLWLFGYGQSDTDIKIFSLDGELGPNVDHHFVPVYKPGIAPQVDVVVCATMSLLVALGCRNSEIEPIRIPVVRQKIYQQSRRHLFRYQVVRITAPRQRDSAVSSGTRKPPAFHLRRGHPRRWKDDYIWIEACWVGDPKNGVVFHDYDATPLSPDDERPEDDKPARLH